MTSPQKPTIQEPPSLSSIPSPPPTQDSPITSETPVQQVGDQSLSQGNNTSMSAVSSSPPSSAVPFFIPNEEATKESIELANQRDRDEGLTHKFENGSNVFRILPPYSNKGIWLFILCMHYKLKNPETGKNTAARNYNRTYGRLKLTPELRDIIPNLPGVSIKVDTSGQPTSYEFECPIENTLKLLKNNGVETEKQDLQKQNFVLAVRKVYDISGKLTTVSPPGFLRLSGKILNSFQGLRTNPNIMAAGGDPLHPYKGLDIDVTYDKNAANTDMYKFTNLGARRPICDDEDEDYVRTKNVLKTLYGESNLHLDSVYDYPDLTTEQGREFWNKEYSRQKRIADDILQRNASMNPYIAQAIKKQNALSLDNLEF